MTEPEQKLTPAEQKFTPAEPDDLANLLSFALRFEGRKSEHDTDRLNADIVAKRLVRYLDKAGYVVMKMPPLGGTLRWPEGLVRSEQGERPLTYLKWQPQEACGESMR